MESNIGKLQTEFLISAHKKGSEKKCESDPRATSHEWFTDEELVQIAERTKIENISKCQLVSISGSIFDQLGL